MYVFFDGCFIVIFYKFVNELSNVFIVSKVYVFVIIGDSVFGSVLILKIFIDIFGGVSDLVFVFENRLVVYISFIYSDRIVVLDLKFYIVIYIIGVGSVLFGFGRYFISWFFIIVGFWIVILVIVSSFVVIINVVIKKLYGMVLGVFGGRGLVVV